MDWCEQRLNGFRCYAQSANQDSAWIVLCKSQIQALTTSFACWLALYLHSKCKKSTKCLNDYKNRYFKNHTTYIQVLNLK